MVVKSKATISKGPGHVPHTCTLHQIVDQSQLRITKQNFQNPIRDGIKETKKKKKKKVVYKKR